MIMGDQKFVCGPHKDRTFEDVAKKDPDICEAIFETTCRNKNYPKKLYLSSLDGPWLSESSVGCFVEKWNADMKAEFHNIIGVPKIQTRQVHSPASVDSNGLLGVFIQYVAKKCIFNVQNANASTYRIHSFASIFPFNVSKVVPATRLSVCELFDEKFYSTIAGFMKLHFEDIVRDSPHIILDLFLRNVYDFKRKHFDESATCRLEKLVNSEECPDENLIASTYVVDYLKQFPRLNEDGVNRYQLLRQMYNGLCAAFGRAGLGDQPPGQIKNLPEINCYQLLQLLNPNFYTDDRAKYVEWFKKYLFFFVYAINSANHPVFFIDDPLYECLLYYAEYRNSREPPENLKLCLWMMALVDHRIHKIHVGKCGQNYSVDDKNLQHIRTYIEQFPGKKWTIVEYGQPTSLLHLRIPIVTEDTILVLRYRKSRKFWLKFREAIIRALMCPFNVERIVMYNPYTGVETSMVVPPLKREVLEFIRRHNKYDPGYSEPVEYIFTKNVEFVFEKDTIQWDDKCPRKSNFISVLDYKDFFDDE